LESKPKRKKRKRLIGREAKKSNKWENAAGRRLGFGSYEKEKISRSMRGDIARKN